MIGYIIAGICIVAAVLVIGKFVYNVATGKSSACASCAKDSDPDACATCDSCALCDISLGSFTPSEKTLTVEPTETPEPRDR